MFSDLLKGLRSKRNVTQGQLAKEIGVSPGNVGDWESGKSKPGYVALASLARFFEVSADDLLELTQIEYASNPNDKLLASQIAFHNLSKTMSVAYHDSKKLNCDDVPLSESEMDLISMYRLLDVGDKKTIFDITKLKYEMMTGEKVSIYSTYADTQEEQTTTQKRSSNSSEGIA